MEQNRRLVILYGSQTGTAQDVAERVGRQARQRHFTATVCAIDEYPLSDLLDESLIIFIVATTGQGAEPSNMRSFWKFLLRSDLPSDLLEHLHFAICGLGDSSYAKYNWPAKKLYRRLLSLGAEEFYEKGEADDQDYLGIDTTLDKWLEGLWTFLLTTFPVPPPLEILSSSVRPPPRLKVTPLVGSSLDLDIKGKARDVSLPPDTRLSTLSRNERATPLDHFQDVRYLEFTFDSEIDFQPGDVAELRPEHSPEQVERFIQLMQWSNPDNPLRIESADRSRPLPSYWPPIMTLRELLTKYLDIFTVPRRSFFEFLAYFTTDELETEKLQEFCSAEGQEDLWDYCNRMRRTIFEVLQEFKSAAGDDKIPMAYLLDLFPEIRPRQFSIASSAKAHSKQVQLLVAIVKYKTKLSLPRKGICTSWLASLPEGSKIPIAIKTGTFALPVKEETPLILIGPGTGIAPFRSFVEECCANNMKAKILVFFGCRSVDKDYYYHSEWSTLVKDHPNVEIVVAASRDQEHKIYVQDRILQKSQHIWEMLQQEAAIYISGAADKMPAAVRKALVGVCETEGNMTTVQAEEYLEKLELDDRLQEETWS